jgi:hypothetical protein
MSSAVRHADVILTQNIDEKAALSLACPLEKTNFFTCEPRTVDFGHTHFSIGVTPGLRRT